MPCHHALAEALRAYIDAAGIGEDRKGFLFRTARGHNANALSERPVDQYAAWFMIRRCASKAGITAPIGCHTFRATGITGYLSNGGALEHAQEMAAHESLRTTLSFTIVRVSGRRRTKSRGSGFNHRFGAGRGLSILGDMLWISGDNWSMISAQWASLRCYFLSLQA